MAKVAVVTDTTSCLPDSLVQEYHIHLVPMDTLYYLAKGGRVPRAAAWASDLLQIKPIIQVVPLSEEVTFAARARTRSRAVEKLLELMRWRTTNAGPLHVIVMHSNVLEEAERLRDRICGEFNCLETYIQDFTPAMGVHTGPGLLGIAFYGD